jgi:hypothetical protein
MTGRFGRASDDHAHAWLAPDVPDTGKLLVRHRLWFVIKDAYNCWLIPLDQGEADRHERRRPVYSNGCKPSNTL